MKNLLDFTGKVVLVTGARSGIGKEAAIEFAEQGAKVVCVGRREMPETMAGIEAAGGAGIFVKGDVSVPGDMEKAVKAAVDTYGKLDAAVNCAGSLAPNKFILDQTEEDFDHIMNTDCKGMFLSMQAEIAQMLEQGGGSIVNIGSIASMGGGPNMAPYIAAKHACLGLTRAAAFELADKNIRVNMVAPGATISEMTEMWRSDPVLCEMFTAPVLQKRFAEASEIAGIILYLASDLSTFATGANFVVDGGQMVP